MTADLTRPENTCFPCNHLPYYLVNVVSLSDAADADGAMDDGVLGPQTPHSLNGLLGMLSDFSEEPPDLATVTSVSDCPLLYQHCKECKEPCVAKDRGQGLHLYCLKHKEARQEVWRRVSCSLRPFCNHCGVL